MFLGEKCVFLQSLKLIFEKIQTFTERLLEIRIRKYDIECLGNLSTINIAIAV